MSESCLDGVSMRVVSTADCGRVDGGTVLRFKEQGSLVSAEFSGVTIQLGNRVGVRAGERLPFPSAQVDRDGRLDGGHSSCEITRTPEGKLQIFERFKCDSRDVSGTNVFEEVDADRVD